jgi:hypothetical protein
MTAAPLRRLALISGLLLVCGCNYVVGLGYLLGGPPSIEPEFDRTTGKSLGDSEVIVAVVCYAPKELKWDNAEVDREIAEYVSYRLNEHKIQVRRPEQVRAWVDANPDWDKPEEIGEGVEVTHVLFIDLSKFSLYEEDAAHLYRGRAEAVVNVVEKQPDGEWDEIFVKELISVYPLAVPRPASQESFGTFKRKYLDRLSEEVGRLFYEYYNGDDLPDVT